MKRKYNRAESIREALTPLTEMPNGDGEIAISGSDSDGEQPPAGVTRERVEIVMVPETEQFKVRRHVTFVYERDASTAAECVTALRELCGGEVTQVAREALYDAGHDPCTGEPEGYPGFTRAFTAAKLEAPALLSER